MWLISILTNLSLIWLQLLYFIHPLLHRFFFFVGNLLIPPPLPSFFYSIFSFVFSDQSLIEMQKLQVSLLFSSFIEISSFSLSPSTRTPSRFSHYFIIASQSLYLSGRGIRRPRNATLVSSASPCLPPTASPCLPPTAGPFFQRFRLN